MSRAMSATAASSEAATTFRGIIYMSIGMVILPCMDGIAKYLSSDLAPLEISFGRFMFQTFIALMFVPVLGGGFRSLAKETTPVQLFRGALLAVCSMLFFTSVKFLPLADAIAIFFVEPMILTALSALILKEKVGIRRWSAVCIGLVGALIIIRPGSSVFNLYSLLPLGAALMFALYLIMMRRLAGTSSMVGIQFTTGLAGMLTIAPVLAITTSLEIEGAEFFMPESWQLSLMVLMGLISAISHGFVAKAFDCAPASVLAPINYVEIIAATIFGFLVFGDIPDQMVWVGVALIASSGIYIAHRERITAKREQKAAEALVAAE